MQFGAQGKPPVGIILDADIGAGIDDILALAMVFGLEAKREARLVSISVSRPSLKSAAFAEAVGRFYSGAVSGAFGAVGRTLPVGLRLDGKAPEDLPVITTPLSKRNEKGEVVYAHGIAKENDTAEIPALIRNALTSQHDQNCVVVLTGPATNLADALAIPGITELISKKVRFLSMMGGAYPDGKPEFNIKANIAAAKKLFAEWPTPIIASGVEIGDALLFPASSIESDFAWAPNHPVVDAYRAYQPMPYDTPSWDLSAVLYAGRPQGNYFKLSDPGRITVLDDGRTKFAPAADGKHRYLILDPAQKENIIKAYIELASEKPAVRQPRRRPQQQQVTPPPPPRPPEAKP